jgi:transposase
VLVERVLSGRPVAHVATELGISRATGHKWLARYRSEGVAGLADRPSRAHHIPTRTSPDIETRVLALRQERKLGPHRIAALVGLSASTVHAILARHGLSRLAWMDRPTGQLIRRYERDRPGELLHVDVKKLGRLRDGGGWRVHGRDSDQSRAARSTPRVGFDYVHAAIDDHTRLAYAEIHPDETAATCAGFLRRAARFFAAHGIDHVERVMTDNALAYRAPTPGAMPWPNSVPNAASPAATAPRPMARQSGSTAPCSTNGPTSAPSPPTPNAPQHYRSGCTPTTTTAATPRSAANHPSPASTTLLGTTPSGRPRRPGAGRW